MSTTEACNEDDVLKRMLNTPPKKHEPTTDLGKAKREAKNGADPKADPAKG